MSRLPVVGSDTDGWGGILNDFLAVALNPDGTLKPISSALVTGLIRPPRVLVAASNAPSAYKTQADYVCTGTNDHTTINTAIASLALGGVCELSMGTFNLGGTINGLDFVELRGQKPGVTIFQMSSDLGAGHWAVAPSDLSGTSITREHEAWAFRVTSLEVRGPGYPTTAALGVSPSNMNGVLAGNGMQVEDIVIDSFHSGLGIDGDHQRFRKINCTNNYYGVDFVDSVTLTYGNQSFYDCNFSANKYAGVRVSPTNMMDMVTMKQVHCGFQPWGIIRDSTPSTSLAFIANSNLEIFFESVGNGAIQDRQSVPASLAISSHVHCIATWNNTYYITTGPSDNSNNLFTFEVCIDFHLYPMRDGAYPTPAPYGTPFGVIYIDRGGFDYGSGTTESQLGVLHYHIDPYDLQSGGPVPIHPNLIGGSSTFGARPAVVVEGADLVGVSYLYTGTITAGDLVVHDTTDGRVKRHDGSSPFAGVALTTGGAGNGSPSVIVQSRGTAPVNSEVVTAGQRVSSFPTTPYHLHAAAAGEPVLGHCTWHGGAAGGGSQATVKLTSESPGTSAPTYRSLSAQTTSGAVTINAQAADVQRITLNGNMTSCTISNPPPTTVDQELYITFVQDGTGTRTIVPPTNIKWAGGTAPTWSTTANWRDTVKIGGYDGTNWFERSRSLAIR